MSRSTIIANILFFLILLGLVPELYSQTPVQVIRGMVTDGSTKQRLPGAFVILPDTEPLLGTTTDENGHYRLEGVPVGRYSMQVSHLAYEALVLSEVLVESGKEVVLDISIREQPKQLGEVVVVVKSPKIDNINVTSLSLQTITVEEVLRFPATFNDPARMAMTYAGVANTNDQANHISVRGNSPNSLSWRLEGAEIVNPNHLGDAGTASNRPSQSGGGVNILSAQMLGTSRFYSGVFPLQYGNAVGGIMDMRFRNGNDEQHEFVAQAALTGFNFSAEGPLLKKKGISYLANYRYSFTGLLTNLGVDFGDEAIGYQDLAFNVKAPVGQNGVLKIFGMGGISNNDFTGQRDSSKWEVDKDRFDIEFNNRMGAVGASFARAINHNATLKTTVVSSTLNARKRSDLIWDNGEVINSWWYDSITISKTALLAQFDYTFNRKHKLSAGYSATRYLFDVNTSNYLDGSVGRANGWLSNVYLEWHWKPLASLDLTIGSQHTSFTLSSSNAIGPRASVSWRLSGKDLIYGGYGLHSQVQPAQVYLVKGTPGNINLGFTRSHHFAVGYHRQFSVHSLFRVEAYYQSLFDVPIPRIENGEEGFSTLNLIGDFESRELVNNGTGTNYGIELTWQRTMDEDYFVLANGSWYESKYTDIIEEERDTRFNGNYLVNLTAGKEFSWNKKDRKKILGINARLTYAGGMRYTPINEETSLYLEFFVTAREYRLSYSLQLEDYFKADIRLYLKNNKPNYNTMLSLDLQNVTNHKNEAYYYFDTTQQRTRVEYQLGLIPNLSYRIEF